MPANCRITVKQTPCYQKKRKPPRPSPIKLQVHVYTCMCSEPDRTHREVLTCRGGPCRYQEWNTCENAAQEAATFACSWHSHQEPELCTPRSGARAARCPCTQETCRQQPDFPSALDLGVQWSCIPLRRCELELALLGTAADNPFFLPSLQLFPAFSARIIQIPNRSFTALHVVGMQTHPAHEFRI
jgi:hypothetical protein